MFVVRLKRPSEDFDLRAFATKRAALARFRTAQALMLDGKMEHCALFEADARDAARAVELVNQGHATLIESNLEDPRPRPPVRKARAPKSAKRKATTRTARKKTIKAKRRPAR
jgi:hypothetical protein